MTSHKRVTVGLAFESRNIMFDCRALEDKMYHLREVCRRNSPITSQTPLQPNKICSGLVNSAIHLNIWCFPGICSATITKKFMIPAKLSCCLWILLHLKALQSSVQVGMLYRASGWYRLCLLLRSIQVTDQKLYVSIEHLFGLCYWCKKVNYVKIWTWKGLNGG